MTQTIVRNGTVVSLDPDVGEYNEADVLIEDGELTSSRA
jgi:hypothetical protein